jgi:hypothetical protein
LGQLLGICHEVHLDGRTQTTEVDVHERQSDDQRKTTSEL